MDSSAILHLSVHGVPVVRGARVHEGVRACRWLGGGRGLVASGEGGGGGGASVPRYRVCAGKGEERTAC